MVGVDLTSGDPNSFAATVVYSLPLVFPLWHHFQNSRLRWALAGYLTLAITCVLLTGSRMGFVGLCSLALIVVLLSKHRIAIVVLLAIAAPLAWKSLPEDRQNRYLTIIDPSYGPKSAQASAEGRAVGFYDGVALWRAHPVLGVGPGVFGVATHKGFASHHLYGQVLGELGTLGALALGGIVLAFGWNLLEARRIFRANPESVDAFAYEVCVAVSVVVVLLLVLGLAGHNLFRSTWLWLGAFEAVALYAMKGERAVIEASELNVVPEATIEGLGHES
jgi:O-antigen ligase